MSKKTAGLLAIIVVLLILLHIPAHKANVKNITKSTCKVMTPFGCGSGAMLPSGHIITAKHVVDINEDGIISFEERHVFVSFHESDFMYPGFVIWPKDGSESKIDVVIIRTIAEAPALPISYKDPDIGDDVVSVGYPLGCESPHVYKGSRSMDEPRGLVGSDEEERYPTHRASLSIEVGVSGGPICDANGNIIGIIVEARLNQIGQITQSWSEYVPMTYVRDALIKDGASWALYDNGSKMEFMRRIWFFMISIIILSTSLIVMHYVLKDTSY